MKTLTISKDDYRRKISTWLNTHDIIKGEISDRTRINVDIVTRDDKHIDITYSLPRMRTYREGTGFARTVAMVFKILCPVPLITGLDYLKEGTLCTIGLDILYIQNNVVKLKFELEVCNGGRIHRAMVKQIELAELESYLPRGFSISGSNLEVDMRLRPLFMENCVRNIRDVKFTSEAWFIDYE